MTKLSEIERRLEKIEARNKRVELDKRWETSWTRRLTIGGLTYMVTFLFLVLLPVDMPAISAFVALIGYVLSNLAVGSMRKIWQRYR